MKRCSASISPPSMTSWRPNADRPARSSLRFWKTGTAPSSPESTLIGNAHLDHAWLWPISETSRKCARTCANMVGYTEEFPEFRFLHSQPVQLENLNRLHRGCALASGCLRVHGSHEFIYSFYASNESRLDGVIREGWDLNIPLASYRGDVDTPSWPFRLTSDTIMAEAVQFPKTGVSTFHSGNSVFGPSTSN